MVPNASEFAAGEQSIFVGWNFQEGKTAEAPFFLGMVAFGLLWEYARWSV